MQYNLVLPDALKSQPQRYFSAEQMRRAVEELRHRTEPQFKVYAASRRAAWTQAHYIILD